MRDLSWLRITCQSNKIRRFSVVLHNLMITEYNRKLVFFHWCPLHDKLHHLSVDQGGFKNRTFSILIGRFQVALNPIMKAKLSAKFLIRKGVFYSHVQKTIL